MGLSTNWDLTKLYPSFDSDEFKSDMQKAKEDLEKAGKWAETELLDYSDTEQKLIKIIEETNEQMTLEWRLSSFTQLTLATDATNETALGMLDRLEKIILEGQILLSKFTRFIGGVENLQQTIDANNKLKEYDYFLNEIYKASKHLLSDDVEKAVARLSLTGGNAWSRMRDMIDGTMTVEIEQDGEMKSLPLPMVRNMAYDKDPEVRKKAYEAELAAYKKIEMPLSHALNAIKGENIAMCEMRGYDSILGKTLEDSRMSKDVLDAMLSAMEDAMPDFRRYMKAKAKYLGHDKGMPFYDMFAPIGANANMKFTYEEAHEFLVDTFKGFSEEMSAFIDYAFKNRWIDALPKEGKGGGAFCANLPFIGESRVLSNFDGSFSSVGTLAHELGHAWHGHCLKHLPIVKTNYPMPLAETASIFNEGVVTDAVLKTADDDTKLAIIEAELMDATQVLVDIYSRYLFESKVIEVRHDHGMSVNEIKEAMLDAQKKAYGDGLDENTLHPYMWACKSHYYIPDLAFYNWPYAFGLLFGKCIAAAYRKAPEGFVERYKELLAATGSADVVDVAKMMNIDLTKKETWKQALDGLVEKVDEFCELVK
ncbi:MAG: M3 family oligoendopeptidase [Eubacteriales bacterium]